jgi:hypothetical protein
MSNPTAELASEFWKLLRGFERIVALTPADARQRFAAQARYAAGRLDTILAAAGMRVVSFDGQPFEENMPAIAINADEVAGSPERLIVERTLEPAVVEGMTVVMTGKVYLAKTSDTPEVR